MTANRYRLLLVASLVFGLAGGTLDFIFPSLMPDEFHAAQKNHDEALPGLVAIYTGLAAVAVLVRGVVSLYGLYFFRPWAPRLALIMTAIALVAMLAMGAWAQSGIASAINFLASYLWGAVLVLPYVPPLNSLFQRPNT